MDFDGLCNKGLVLGLGLSSSTEEHMSKKPDNSAQKLDCLVQITDEPSLTLSLSGETFDLKKIAADSDKNHNKGVAVNDNHHHHQNHQSGDDNLYGQDSAASSFSNVSSVKREREFESEEVEIERVISSRVSDEDDDGSKGRKKLRLTKAQSALLEESFKQQSTLNPKQKQDLARGLKLRPRQVEVWFQNRRARTKLKQTEVDCEFLKKCCETLTDENLRLQKELKAMKLAQPLYMQLPAATLTMCPSCERMGGAAAGGGSSEKAAKSPFVMAPKPHFYNPFTNSSAAC